MSSVQQPEQPRAFEKIPASGLDTTIDSKEREQLQISGTFHAADSDVTFKSSDGVLFELHKLNLAVTARGFPPIEFRSSNEIVELSETSDVLALLFQFCYPQRHPDLELVEVNVLVALAEAAEKYEVFAAMSVCSIRMKEHISQRPFDVMLYAAKHDYTDILEDAYKLVLKEPLGEIITKLPPHLVIPWVLHHEQYARILRKSFAQYKNWVPGHDTGKKRHTVKEHEMGCRFYTSLSCRICEILQNLGEGVGALTELNKIFSRCCDRYPNNLIRWHKALEEDIKQIPPFHTLL